MDDLISLVAQMTDDECKSWLKMKANKKTLRSYWDEKYPGVTVTNTGEIMYDIKYHSSPICENGNHKKFKQFPKGYYTSCEQEVCKCKIEMRKEIRKGIKERTTPEQKAQYQANFKATMMKRYGVTNPTYLPDHQEKSRETMIKHYGQPTVKNVKEVQDKVKNTCLARYGVEYYRQTDECKERIKNTCLEKYGVEQAIVADVVVKKRHATMIERYGINNHFKSAENQQKIIEDRKLKYGYENVGQRFLSPETYEILKDREKFAKVVTGLSYEAAARRLNTSANTIANYVVEYDLHNVVHKGQGSVMQTEIAEWIKSLNFNIRFNDRTILAPKEVDILIPEHKLGIEYNGIYHHTEVSGGKSKDYHKNKLVGCNAKGYDLIQICSTSYRKNPDLIKSIVLSRLGCSTPIFARKCQIVEVSHNDSSEFLKHNHLQNHLTSGSIRYGLVFNDELVQVMTFGALRKSLNYKFKEDTWEIIRLATKQNYSVVGGMSRLLKHFITVHNPNEIISFTDLRYFTGKSLEKFGFTCRDVNEPSYWYTDYHKVYHRYNFTKQTLVKNGHDPKKTEWQIMQELGYDRLWDCGQAKWTLTIKNSGELLYE